MTPIAPILEDIKRNLNINDIRFSFENENQHLVMSTKVSGQARKINSSAFRSVEGLSTHIDSSTKISTQSGPSKEQGFAANPEDPQSLRSSESTKQSGMDVVSRQSPYLEPTTGVVTVPSTSSVPIGQELSDESEHELSAFQSSLRGSEPGVSERIGLPQELQLGTNAAEDVLRESGSVPVTVDLNQWSPGQYDKHRECQRFFWRFSIAISSLFRRLTRPLFVTVANFSRTLTRLVFGTIANLFRIPSRLWRKLWRRLETYFLRSEYRSRKMLKRPHYPFGLGTMISRPFTAYDRFAKGNKYGAWNIVYLVLEVFLNVLYFVGCFPFLLAVRSRHQAVLEDEETLRRQKYMSINMLGRLYLDVNAKSSADYCGRYGR